MTFIARDYEVPRVHLPWCMICPLLPEEHTEKHTW
jgi:hypothetical protein